MPELPHDTAVNLEELLERERGLPRAQAKAMNAQVTARAAGIGLTFHTDAAIATNTRTAHRLIHFAKAQGKQHEMVMGLFKAYFGDGLNVGDSAVLADLAALHSPDFVMHTAHGDVGIDFYRTMLGGHFAAFPDAVSTPKDITSRATGWSSTGRPRAPTPVGSPWVCRRPGRPSVSPRSTSGAWRTARSPRAGA